jgi:hypothetical protein
VDLWAVTSPTVAPCGGRDEAVKVTKQTPPHVRMKLTKLYRLETAQLTKIRFNLLNLKEIF